MKLFFIIFGAILAAALVIGVVVGVIDSFDRAPPAGDNTGGA